VQRELLAAINYSIASSTSRTFSLIELSYSSKKEIDSVTSANFAIWENVSNNFMLDTFA